MKTKILKFPDELVMKLVYLQEEFALKSKAIAYHFEDERLARTLPENVRILQKFLDVFDNFNTQEFSVFDHPMGVYITFCTVQVQLETLLRCRFVNTIFDYRMNFKQYIGLVPDDRLTDESYREYIKLRGDLHRGIERLKQEAAIRWFPKAKDHVNAWSFVLCS